MECRIYKSLSELPPYYQKLFDDSFDNNFYSSKLWFDTLCKTTRKSNDKLFIIGVEDKESALGIMLLVQSQFNFGPFTIKKLSSLTNVYSITFSPLVISHYQQENAIITKLSKAILSLSGKWDILDLQNMEVNAPFFKELLRQLDQSKYINQSYFCHKNWYEHTKDENFDAYLNKRKSKVKSNHRRRLKKIENELGKPEFLLYSNPDNLDYALQEYNKIYAKSWKGEEQHPEFIEELINATALHNSLRLGLYSANGKTIAAKLAFATKTTGHMYKTAYDPEYRKYGAGTAINMFMIEHLLNVDNVELLDFGIGDEHYKSELMQSSQERWGITAYNNKSFIGYVIGNYNTIGRLIKKNLASLQKLTNNKKSQNDAAGKKLINNSKKNQPSNIYKYEFAIIKNISKILIKIKNNFAQIGKSATFYYILDKILRGLKIGSVYPYYFLSQPLDPSAVNPRLLKKYRIEKMAQGDQRLTKILPDNISAMRFRQNAVCVGAFREDILTALLWFTPGIYHEDEVRADFIPPSGGCWDFGVHIEPDYRMTRVFSSLWAGSSEIMQEMGFAQSYSRISALNPNSLKSQLRMGAKLLGKAVFINLGPLQISIANRQPRLHISFSKKTRVIFHF